MATGLNRPLGSSTVHLCIDMQRLFAPGGPWETPWMPRVAPIVHRVATAFRERTVFTRFIPPVRPEDMPGVWQRYYTRWQAVTQSFIEPALLDLLPELRALVPPAT